MVDELSQNEMDLKKTLLKEMVNVKKEMERLDNARHSVTVARSQDTITSSWTNSKYTQIAVASGVGIVMGGAIYHLICEKLGVLTLHDDVVAKFNRAYTATGDEKTKAIDEYEKALKRNYKGQKELQTALSFDNMSKLLLEANSQVAKNVVDGVVKGVNNGISDDLDKIFEKAKSSSILARSEGAEIRKYKAAVEEYVRASAEYVVKNQARGLLLQECLDELNKLNGLDDGSIKAIRDYTDGQIRLGALQTELKNLEDQRRSLAQQEGMLKGGHEIPKADIDLDFPEGKGKTWGDVVKSLNIDRGRIEADVLEQVMKNWEGELPEGIKDIQSKIAEKRGTENLDVPGRIKGNTEAHKKFKAAYQKALRENEEYQKLRQQIAIAKKGDPKGLVTKEGWKQLIDDFNKGNGRTRSTSDDVNKRLQELDAEIESKKGEIKALEDDLKEGGKLKTAYDEAIQKNGVPESLKNKITEASKLPDETRLENARNKLSQTRKVLEESAKRKNIVLERDMAEIEQGLREVNGKINTEAKRLSDDLKTGFKDALTVTDASARGNIINEDFAKKFVEVSQIDDAGQRAQELKKLCGGVEPDDTIKKMADAFNDAQKNKGIKSEQLEDALKKGAYTTTTKGGRLGVRLAGGTVAVLTALGIGYLAYELAQPETAPSEVNIDSSTPVLQTDVSGVSADDKKVYYDGLTNDMIDTVYSYLNKYVVTNEEERKILQEWCKMLKNDTSNNPAHLQLRKIFKSMHESINRYEDLENNALFLTLQGAQNDDSSYPMGKHTLSQFKMPEERDETSSILLRNKKEMMS